jgi:cell wall-associated NlpC family hydrolase
MDDEKFALALEYCDRVTIRYSFVMRAGPPVRAIRTEKPMTQPMTSPTSTSPAWAGPAWTGPASTGPISTGPISTGPISTSEASISSRPTRLLRTRRLVVALTATLAACTGVLAIGPASASANRGGLPTNAMAPVVTNSARQALDSYTTWTTTDDPAAYRSYVWYRTQTAQFAATELGYDQQAMAEAWATTPVDHQIAVLAAMTQIGVPYRTNSSQEGVGFDCSGLTAYAWSKAGVQLVRQSGGQIKAAKRIDRASAKAGDLVQYPGHVMLYLGVGQAIIHSVMHGRTVELDTISFKRAASVRFGDPAA